MLTLYHATFHKAVQTVYTAILVVRFAGLYVRTARLRLPAGTLLIRGCLEPVQLGVFTRGV